MRSRDPDYYQWGLTEQLIAHAADLLHILAWQNSKDGQKNKNQPKPIERPGVEPSVKKRRVTKMTPEELGKIIPFRKPDKPITLGVDNG